MPSPVGALFLPQEPLFSVPTVPLNLSGWSPPSRGCNPPSVELALSPSIPGSRVQFLTFAFPTASQLSLGQNFRSPQQNVLVSERMSLIFPEQAPLFSLRLTDGHECWGSKLALGPHNPALPLTNTCGLGHLRALPGPRFSHL